MLLVMSSNESAAVSAELSDDPTGASVDKVDAGSESGRDDEAKDDANLAQKVGGSSTNSGEVEVDDDVALTFPQRLMEILDNEENSETIAWLPHGRGFVIFRKKAFEQKILPKYFNKQSKYSSFTRKLNRWGFCRVTRGPESGAYYHQFFRRGGHRLVMQMSCQSSTKSSGSTIKSIPTPNYAGLSTGGVSAAAAGNVMYPSMSLQSVAAEQAISQQQQQLLQIQLQQQLLQQEMLRRALTNQPQLQLPVATAVPNPQPQQEALLAQMMAANLVPSQAGAVAPTNARSAILAQLAAQQGTAAPGSANNASAGGEAAAPTSGAFNAMAWQNQAPPS